MNQLVFTGNISFEEIFQKNKTTIYTFVINAIDKNLNSKFHEKIRVVNIVLNNFNYAIDLTPPYFEIALDKALHVFLEEEDYEKCEMCKRLMDRLK